MEITQLIKDQNLKNIYPPDQLEILQALEDAGKRETVIYHLEHESCPGLQLNPDKTISYSHQRGGHKRYNFNDYQRTGNS